MKWIGFDHIPLETAMAVFYRPTLPVWQLRYL